MAIPKASRKAKRLENCNTPGSSYIVSLPKKWIQDLGLRQGDHVLILRQGNSTLQITPASKRAIREQKEATIEVGKDHNPYFIAREADCPLFRWL